MSKNDYVVEDLLALSPEDYVYVASVYTQDPEGTEHAFDNANKTAAWLASKGVKVFAPISHSHPISKLIPKEMNTHAFWMAQDYPMVRHAAALVFTRMPGFEKSKGMRMEKNWANKQGKPVYFLEWPLDV